MYLADGFMHLQKAVGEAIIQWKMTQLNKTLNTDFNMDVRVWISVKCSLKIISSDPDALQCVVM